MSNSERRLEKGCIPPFAGVKSFRMYFLEVSEMSPEPWRFYAIILGSAVHKYTLPYRPSQEL